jgi:hypothetical protein
LYLNLYIFLARFYAIPEYLVPQIILEVTVKINNVVTSIDFWSIRYVRPNRFTAIIDCCEMKIQNPSSLTQAQQTFSSYKHACTFKVIVACDERGFVTFVSDIYSGGISDKEITVKSGFLNLLKPGESILADRGFEISQMLLDRGCTLNLPHFNRKGGQFSDIQMHENRKIGSRRIIIENVNCRAKKWKILDRIEQHYNHLADMIVKNCFFLVNFCSPLKDLKKENSNEHRVRLTNRLKKKIQSEFE